jgi:NAD(P)-dependent dehydrogenase (short-subunit alcohol dehydrogenase family)
MADYRFDGRVALVTGGARGIGQAHANLLAERGASVVVNDVGGTIEGVGADSKPAATAAAAIVAAGGIAIPNTEDISTAEGGKAAVDAAIDHFGRIDIIVNNAGIVLWAGPLECDLANLQRTLDVHVAGSFNTTIAAWPRMVEQGYGRVVMTTSTGIFGLPENLTYAAAKAAVVGLCRSMAGDAPEGIKINVIAPNASTRMGIDPRTNEPLRFGGMAADSAGPAMPPALVSPVVAYLAHEACPVNGEVYVAGGGRVSRMFIGMTKSYTNADLSIEDVAEHWDAINDEAGYHVPTSTIDASVHLFTS